MNVFKKAIAAASVAGALGLAGAANADTYTFTQASSGFNPGVASPYGQVVTTGEGTNSVSVVVTLFNGTLFNGAGNSAQHHALTFNLLGSPSLTGVTASPTGTSGFTWDGPATGTGTGSFSQAGFGTFEYAFECNDNHNCGNTLSFTLTGTSALTFSPIGTTYFSADIAGGGPTGPTGDIGAIKTGGAVPEPATWALMITGIGLAGAMLRRRQGLASPTRA